MIYRQLPYNEPYLQVSVDENIFPSLSFSVKEKRLIIAHNSDSNLNPTRFVIYTNSKNLNGLHLSGAGDIRLENEVNARNMKIEISGAGDLKADSLYCENIHLHISGAGKAEIAGAATKAAFQISGAGDVDAFHFLAEELDCRISGAGDMEVFVTKTLSASISGTGNLNYRGNPERVNTSVSGTGKIKKVDND